MYFPYLYGRQGETRAIEDMAGRLGNPQAIFPIIEPVVENIPDLSRALDAMKTNGNSVYLIVNPSRYKLETTDAVARWTRSAAAYIADVALVRPTLELRTGVRAADLTTFLTANAGREVGVSVRTSHIAPSVLARITSGLPVLHFLHASADPAGYSSAVGASRAVEVRDSFRAEVRNADYSGEEIFTIAPSRFAMEGRVGFSDYTILPGKFNASGGPLGAAVIHMSFADPSDDSIWVQHFVSIETRQYQGSQPSKLMEAMTKLDAQVRTTPGRFVSTTGFASYQDQFSKRSPTSPTYNKRQQISHHVETIATVL